LTSSFNFEENLHFNLLGKLLSLLLSQHPVFARELLSPIEYLVPALDIPVHHHEHFDGSGYPQGLKGEQIPLAVRIFSVVDEWDALTSDRPYRRAWTKDAARKYILDQKGKRFDPLVVDEFIKSISL
jgi:response regulator RpfG family c-di-GMP phosphodiesterase